MLQQVSSISSQVSMASPPELNAMTVFSIVAGGLQTPRKEIALPGYPLLP